MLGTTRQHSGIILCHGVDDPTYIEEEEERRS
jgi:hypothetical protein